MICNMIWAFCVKFGIIIVCVCVCVCVLENLDSSLVLIARGSAWFPFALWEVLVDHFLAASARHQHGGCVVYTETFTLTDLLVYFLG